jgi:hypothetical protein
VLVARQRNVGTSHVATGHTASVRATEETMSEHDCTHANGTQTQEHRHASIALDDGGCIIYDRENTEAWIQADDSDSLMEVRA